MLCVLVPGKLFCKLKLIAIAKAGRDSSDLQCFHAQKSTFQCHQKKLTYRNAPLNAQPPLSFVQQQLKMFICNYEFVTAGRQKQINWNCFLIAPVCIWATRKLQIPVLWGVNHLAHLKNVSPVEGQTHVLFPSIWICCQIWQSWHKQRDSLLLRQMVPTES